MKSDRKGWENAFLKKSIINTKQIEEFISSKIGFDLTTFFDQYLRDIRIPNLEYSISDGLLTYRWIDVIDDFTMPLEIEVLGENIWIYPTTKKKSIEINSSEEDSSLIEELKCW